MSCNEWESGTIKLPTAEFAKVRQAIADTVLKQKTEMFEHSQLFWKGLTAKQRSNQDDYRVAWQAYQAKNTRQPRVKVYGHGVADGISTLPAGLHELIRAYGSHYTTTPPKRVLKESMDFPTNRSLNFETFGGEAEVRFDKASSSVTWEVDENNRAVDRAHADPLGETFFAALKAVRWTSGTGGHFVGNDEYNRDSDHAYSGGGAHYTTSGWGPLGALYEPGRTEAYRTSKDVLVRQADFPANKKWAAEVASARKREATKAAAKQRREDAKRLAARIAAATAAAGPQGRVAAGNGSHGGEFGVKGQSGPEITLGS